MAVADVYTFTQLEKRTSRFLTWLASGCLAALLIAALPLFLRMGVWVDSTLYDVAVANIRLGGVHYRDVFDTNLPGMLWLHAVLRSLFGWQYEALRAVDLVIFSSIVLLLSRYLAGMGVGLTHRIWTAFALYAFYFSLPERSHCQRDIWMLAPALAALHLRGRQVELGFERTSTLKLAGLGGIEGLCWGGAAWIKPFVLLPAFVCWLGSRWLCVSDRRQARAGLAGLLAGGVLAIGLGVAWLITSGTWPYFYEVMVGWNPEYGAHHAYHWHTRRGVFETCAAISMPWTLLHLAAIPLVLLAMWTWRQNANNRLDRRARYALMLGLFYLAWLFQVFLLQPRLHCYTMDSSALVALAVIPAVASAHLWSRPLRRLLLLEFAIWAALVHPLARPERLSLWATALTSGSAELRDRLSLHSPRENGRIAWVDLDRVAAYLRQRRVGDGELVCLNDSTHLLYVRLGVRPAVRYMQFGIISLFLSRHEQVSRELRESRARLAVTDLVGMGLDPQTPLEALPEVWEQRFPWMFPVVFRAGPYLVHEVHHPIVQSSPW